MHPLIRKNCASVLTRPLFHLFSFNSGMFLIRWKASYITPIFKSGSRTMVENYRGIAILPTLGKLFESIVCSIITKRVSIVLPKAQHGFLLRGVVHQLICLNLPTLQVTLLSLAIN